VNILKKMRTIDILTKVLLSYPLCKLIKHQKKNLLEEFSSSKDDRNIKGAHLSFDSENTPNASVMKLKNSILEVFKGIEKKKKYDLVERKLLAGILSNDH
jgi:hypothetical protein